MFKILKYFENWVLHQLDKITRSLRTIESLFERMINIEKSL